jgi:hypothetical protein
MRRRSPRVETLVSAHGRGVLLTAARELKTPNRLRTWQAEHWESQAWERAFGRLANGRATPMLSDGLWIPEEPIPVGKVVRVVIRRLVPSARAFIKDADNLRFTTKPVNDALKRAGLIPGDSKKLLDQPEPRQAVSEDGKYWTQIYIEPVPAALAARVR